MKLKHSMKRLNLLFVGLAFAVASSAQATLKPTLKVGLEKKYRVENLMKTTVPMSPSPTETKMVGLTMMTVKSVTADSAVVEQKLKPLADASSDATDPNQAAMQSLADVPFLFSMNLDGTYRYLLNPADIKAAFKKAFSSILPEDRVENYVEKALNVDNLQEMFGSIFTVYGKDLKKGCTETKKVLNMPMTVTYALEPDGKTVDVTGNINMTEADLKAFFLEQFAAMGKDQSSAELDQMWGMLKSMGMTEAKGNIKTASVIGDDGWLKSSNGKGSFEVMGAKTDVTITITEE